MSRLAPSSGGAAAVHDRSLVLYDERGVRAGEQKLDKRAGAVARFGDEWLVLADKQKHLGRVSAGAAPASFAAGKAAIGAFGVGRDDAVAVARGGAVELWSRDDERRWSTAQKAGGGRAAATAFHQIVVARDHVVAVGEDGALYFFAREKGELLGALRLASTDPPNEWRLVHVDAGVVVLALGDWLVWIDASTRKTVRRVRARAKVVELAADGDHVVAAVDDGFVQAFRAGTGEPRAALAVHDEAAVAIALGPAALFTMSSEGAVRAAGRESLDVATRVASPVSSIAARGSVAAVGDRSGRVRVVESSGGELRDVGALACAEGVVGLFLAKDDTVIAAGTRVALRASPPYQAPRPIALKAPPTAFVADEAYAFAGTQAGAVDVYDVAAGRPVTTYALSSDDRITALVRLAGAMLVVGTGALDGRVLVVDVAEAKVVHRISPHEEAFGVTCLASDLRGRIVASGSDDGSVALLDPQKGRVLAKLRVAETPTSMAFEPSGRRLACVFADGTAAIVTFAQRGATVSDLGLRGASHVAWADGLVFGFKDGHVESGDRHARPSERPAAARQ
ncbi:MAG: PQQ-binding-like beta-propeller repeat protein [Labilithrix sp.]|nr:PQQ-binding-like beta-propeller repeat protein [Labilithrix sp.]